MTYINPDLEKKYIKKPIKKNSKIAKPLISKSKISKTNLNKKSAKRVNRINRKSYFISIILTYALILLGSFLDIVLYAMLGKDIESNEIGSPIFLVTFLVSMVFYIKVGILRLHDIDRSGWEILLSFIPIVGLIITIIMLFQKGTEGSNKYGYPVNKLYILWITNENIDLDKTIKNNNDGKQNIDLFNDNFSMFELDKSHEKKPITKKRKYGENKSHRKIWYLVAGCLVFVFFLAQPTIDFTHYMIGNNFADERIQEIADGAGFNYRGKVIFYKTNPELVNATTLNRHCPNDDQNVIEYGCYDTQTNRIYLLEVSDSNFDEIEYNIAAHEMLHSVFMDLDYEEYILLQNEIDKIYNSDNVSMQTIKEDLKTYEQDELTIANELHSFVGASLSTSESGAILNDYYSKYFDNRNKAVFAEKSFDRKIVELSARLDADRAALERTEAELAAYKAEWLDKIERAMRRNEYYGDYVTYNKNVDAYNNNLDIYNSKIDVYEINRIAYNKKVDDYNKFMDSFRPKANKLQTIPE